MKKGFAWTTSIAEEEEAARECVLRTYAKQQRQQQHSPVQCTHMRIYTLAGPIGEDAAAWARVAIIHHQDCTLVFRPHKCTLCTGQDLRLSGWRRDALAEENTGVKGVCRRRRNSSGGTTNFRYITRPRALSSADPSILSLFLSGFGSWHPPLGRAHLLIEDGQAFLFFFFCVYNCLHPTAKATPTCENSYIRPSKRPRLHRRTDGQWWYTRV